MTRFVVAPDFVPAARAVLIDVSQELAVLLGLAAFVALSMELCHGFAAAGAVLTGLGAFPTACVSGVAPVLDDAAIAVGFLAWLRIPLRYDHSNAMISSFFE